MNGSSVGKNAINSQIRLLVQLTEKLDKKRGVASYSYKQMKYQGHYSWTSRQLVMPLIFL